MRGFDDRRGFSGLKRDVLAILFHIFRSGTVRHGVTAHAFLNTRWRQRIGGGLFFLRGFEFEQAVDLGPGTAARWGGDVRGWIRVGPRMISCLRGGRIFGGEGFSLSSRVHLVRCDTGAKIGRIAA